MRLQINNYPACTKIGWSTRRQNSSPNDSDLHLVLISCCVFVYKYIVQFVMHYEAALMQHQ